MFAKIVKYLLFFYAIYFLGHFTMSMVYRFGSTATNAFGILSCAAIIFAFWRAASHCESEKGIHYGILTGFFMWCFFGELLEHEGVMEIAALGAVPALATYISITLVIVYKKYLPMGVRFALGHFGCIWLFHFILVNQAEVVQVKYPEVFQLLIVITGVTFFATALLLFFKMVVARSEKAFVAYLLFSFICFWGTVETLQVMDLLPGYTYYSYWSKRVSLLTKATAPENYVVQKGGNDLSVSQTAKLQDIPLPEEIVKAIASIKEQYGWKSGETKELAGYLLKKLPSQVFFEKFTRQLDEKMRQENKKKVDEAMLCQIIKESFINITVSNVNNHIRKQIHQFKEEKSNQDGEYELLKTTMQNIKFFERIEGEIAFLKEGYEWESKETKELAGYLLMKFPTPLLIADLNGRLNEKMKQENKERVSEEMFVQIMEEGIVSSTISTVNNLIRIYVQQYKSTKIT